MQGCNQYDEQGRRHGLWEHYFDNGNLYYRRTYRHGVLHGPAESYWDDGRLWSRGTWYYDEMMGLWEWGVGGCKPEYYARM